MYPLENPQPPTFKKLCHWISHPSNTGLVHLLLVDIYWIYWTMAEAAKVQHVWNLSGICHANLLLCCLLGGNLLCHSVGLKFGSLAPVLPQVPRSIQLINPETSTSYLLTSSTWFPLCCNVPSVLVAIAFWRLSPIGGEGIHSVALVVFWQRMSKPSIDNNLLLHRL